MPARAAERTVVVLLFDGWAPALLDGVPTPALDRMRREGAWTHRFVPPFPSISLISGVVRRIFRAWTPRPPVLRWLKATRPSR